MHHYLWHLWTWSLLLCLPLGAFCWAKSSGRCLTKGGPCPCLYGLSECPRTFLVIFSKRGHTHSLPQFPSRSGHLQIQGQALNQRWHHKDHEPQGSASRCPGHRVRGFPILHRACAYLQAMERGFVYISHRTCEIKKAEGQQRGSHAGWVSWGEMASVAWTTRVVFIGSNRKVQTALCWLLERRKMTTFTI